MTQGINGDAYTESVNCYVPTPHGRTKEEREAAICVCFPRVSPTHFARPRAFYIFDTAHGRGVKESFITLIWSINCSPSVDHVRYRRAEASDVFEPWTETGREHFAHQGSGPSQIFKVIVSNREKILKNIHAVVWRQVELENSSLPIAVRCSKSLHA